jgi:photosystem II stability/assembly factor-like uncharacterized protein
MLIAKNTNASVHANGCELPASGVSFTANSDFGRRRRLEIWIRVGLLSLVMLLLCSEAQAQWSSQTSGTANNLRGVHFISDNVGWAVGFSGTILNTTDGGTNWTAQTSNTTANLLGVRALDANVVWAAGAGAIVRTTDGGGNWTAFPGPASEFINTIFPVSATVALAPVSGSFGTERHFGRFTVLTPTTIGEEIFDSVPSSSPFLDIYFTDADNGWATGFGQIRRITNATGTPPTFAFQTSGTAQTLNGIQMVDASNGWIAGNSGTILHTTNGGTNWGAQTSGVPATSFFDVFVEIDLMHGWAVGATGTILATINGGNSWFTENSGVAVTLRSVFFPSGTGYAVGDSGTILVRRAPTDIALESFTASGFDDGQVLLQWRTGFEVNNLGFNIYREQEGKRIPLNEQVIAGSALMAGPGTSLTAGHSYNWADPTLESGKGVSYWLEEIDLNGNSAWDGPVKIKRSPADKAPRGSVQMQATLLSMLGMQQTQVSNGVSSSQLERKAAAAEMTPAQVQIQSDIASQPAVKISVKQAGWCRVTQQEFVAAGLDPKADTRTLQLYSNGRQIPISVIQGGNFASTYAIEFYGLGLDAASTNTHTYWLVAGKEPGLRIKQAPGGLSQPASGSFPYIVERKDRTIYFSSLRNGDKENFFGAVIARAPVDLSLSARHLASESAVQAVIEVSLQGVTLLRHSVKVLFNGSDVGEVNFNGQAQGTAKLLVPQSQVREGENLVRLTAQGGDADVSLVDAVRLTYRHSYTADSNALRLTALAGQRVTIDGFTSSAIRIVDVTDPDAVLDLTPHVTKQQTGYAATITVPGAGARSLLAVTDDQVKSPSAIAANRPSNLRQPGPGADMIIITTREFADSIESRRALRQSQGLSVAVVDVEDIFDEFSYGDKLPQAIKDFLAFAKTDWWKAPRFVLFVGDASLDPKNYLGLGGYDFVPTKLVDTQLMETASDDWFGDTEADGLAGVAIGRLPVRTPQQATAMIARIIGYERANAPGSVLLVADRNEGFDFESANDRLKELISDNVKVEEIKRGGIDAATAKSMLIESINRGQKIVNYTGHGSVNGWRSDLFSSADIRSLTNAEHLPLFITMTCLNGYFQDPALDSLAESLLKAERGGAVAVWASSGMTTPDKQAMMDQEMFRLLFGRGTLTLGEATLKAKAATGDRDVRRTWILFGDPTMKLR